VTSAIPPKADIAERDRHVRFVPKADIDAADKEDERRFVGAPAVGRREKRPRCTHATPTGHPVNRGLLRRTPMLAFS